MMNEKRIVVLRLGHRPERDKRITTHVCLVARAFGAEGVYISGIRDESIKQKMENIIKNWGGKFWIEFIDNPLNLVKNWKKSGGVVVHLTMYGIPISKIIDKIPKDKEILVIVGSEKVPKEYYYESDYNIAIGNQPHSEVSALAIFLDRITNGAWEYLKFPNAKLLIVPSEKGKKVIRISE
ncbi:MAG: tRNA (cytidine(56)-2'-O)-methyltransferase [Candidatus Verstraetearchaeota archaeon]|nr:tRNA (cytidine(56)-2'-O)-methyltransferase [Candidatus Verstraetearchaeota archaeon]